jgi:hypothetical protein
MDLPYVEVNLEQRKPGTVPPAVLEDSVDDVRTRVARRVRRTLHDLSEITVAELAAETGVALRDRFSAIEEELDAELQTLSEVASSLGYAIPSDSSDATTDASTSLLDFAKEAAWHALGNFAATELLASLRPDDVKAAGLCELARERLDGERFIQRTGLPADEYEEFLSTAATSLIASKAVSSPRVLLNEATLVSIVSSDGLALRVREANGFLLIDSKEELRLSDASVGLTGDTRIVALAPARFEEGHDGTRMLVFAQHPGVSLTLRGDATLPSRPDDVAIALRGRAEVFWNPKSAFEGVAGSRGVLFFDS